MQDTIIEIPFGKIIVCIPYFENVMNLKTKKNTVFKEKIDLSLVNGTVEVILPKEEFGNLSFVLEVSDSCVTKAIIYKDKIDSKQIVIGFDRTLLYSIYSILNIIAELNFGD